MKIILHGQTETVMSNPLSKHNYFGWPTVARLKNGKIAVVASGYRLRHICPFGKMVISYSEDEGKTYTAPAPLIDTTLDDRDGGIMTFGDSGVLVASFNNTRAFQRSLAYATPYDLAYLDRVTDAEEARDLGSTFRISTDNGVTFGPIHKSPSPPPTAHLSFRTELCSGSEGNIPAMIRRCSTIRFSLSKSILTGAPSMSVRSQTLLISISIRFPVSRTPFSLTTEPC